ncbi:MAG: helix-turn-helix transcriptional regulator [Lachnospiraceae bacterium]|nr:helix-turn-helix transcriptional regulator [Lachnospiraceae bacterium]
MDIGQKLKAARSNVGLTQELVAEKLGVSRQTLSNWENNKTYPDIISVIGLSDLYSVSLDELLKEDKKMIQHLEESTNVVKSRRKFSKLIHITSYLVIWAMLLMLFWFGKGGGDAMGFGVLAFYIILPVATIVISFFIGKGDEWGRYKWFLIIFFGIMFMLMEYATFNLANMIEFNKVNMPEFTAFLQGAVYSAVGMVVGFLADKARKKRT